MKLEQSVGPTGLGEVLVTVTGKAEVAPGATNVTFRCLDRRGRLVTAARHPWPLQKDGPDPAPHIHQPASARELGADRELPPRYAAAAHGHHAAALK